MSGFNATFVNPGTIINVFPCERVGLSGGTPAAFNSICGVFNFYRFKIICLWALTIFIGVMRFCTHSKAPFIFV